MASTLHLKSLTGMSMTDEEVRDVPNPTLEVGIHVTLKTLEAGSVLSAFVLAPLVQLVKGPRSFGAIACRSIRFVRFGSVVGLAAGPPLFLWYKDKKQIDHDGMYDRCYRLRYNRCQTRVDRLAISGALLGLLLPLTRFPPLIRAGFLGCAGLGLATGTVVAGAYNNLGPGAADMMKVKSSHNGIPNENF